MYTKNVFIELVECIRKGTKVPFPRPSIDMTSSNLELQAYLLYATMLLLLLLKPKHKQASSNIPQTN